MSEGYKDDLAYIHDAGYGQVACAAARHLLDLLRQRGMSRGLVVELGCGSGSGTHLLAAAGYDVLGIDQSAAMIGLARARVPRGDFRVESFVTAAIPPCIAVTAIGEPLNYLFDRHNTGRQLVRLFRRVHAALPSGGLFLFDVATPGRVRGPGPQRHFREGEGWAVLVEVEKDRRRNVLTRRITSFRKIGDSYRRDYEEHRQRLFAWSELAAPLRRVGFRVRRLAGYGPLRFPRGLVGFLACKR